MFVDDREHLGRREVLEARPAQVVVAASSVVLALGKDAALDRLAEAGGLVLFERVQVVEPLDEEQIGDLLDHLERVGDAARPEGVPDARRFGLRISPVSMMILSEKQRIEIHQAVSQGVRRSTSAEDSAIWEK